MKMSLLLLLPLAGCAATVDQAAAPPLAPGLSPAQTIAARQSAFQLSAAVFGGMKALTDGTAEVKGAAFGARGLARWARTLPSMFPNGSDVAPAHAKAALWANRADFEAKAAAYAAAATALAEAAQANDKAAFAIQWKAVGQACAACHDLYRDEPAH